MQKSGQESLFWGISMVLLEAFIYWSNEYNCMFFNLNNPFASELYTIPSVLGPMCGFILSPGRSRVFIFAFKVDQSLKKAEMVTWTGLQLKQQILFTFFSARLLSSRMQIWCLGFSFGNFERQVAFFSLNFDIRKAKAWQYSQIWVDFRASEAFVWFKPQKTFKMAWWP